MNKTYSIDLYLVRIDDERHQAKYSNFHGFEYAEPIVGIPARRITITIERNVTEEELNNG